MGRREHTRTDNDRWPPAAPVDGQDEVLGAAVPRQPWWLAFVVGGLIVAVVATLVVRVVTRSTASSNPPPVVIDSTTVPHSSARAQQPSSPAAITSARAAPVTVALGTSLLGVRAGWELYERGSDSVVRIDLAQGRVTSTAVPTLASSGPVSFVLGSASAIVRPIDGVPGYVIADGRPARELTGVLAADGPVFPGPTADEFWVPGGDSAAQRMVLVTVDGRAVGPSLTIPPGSSSLSALADQTGYLVFPDLDGGSYDARPGGVSKISTGTILAVGPTRWLVSECPTRHRCSTVVIDRSTGTRTKLVAPPVTGNGPVGVISPAGSVAALVAGASSPALELLDLVTGAARTLPLLLDLSTYGNQSMVWAPDGRYVFVIGANGHLYAVNAQTDHATDLTEATDQVVPELSQLAIRPAATR